MGLSAEVERQQLEALYKSATRYVRLCRWVLDSALAPGKLPNKDGSLPTGLVEVSTGGYAPQSVAASAWNAAVAVITGPSYIEMPATGAVGWTLSASQTNVTCYVITSDTNPISSANYLSSGCFVDVDNLDPDTGQPIPLAVDLTASVFFGWTAAAPLRVRQGAPPNGANPL